MARRKARSVTLTTGQKKQILKQIKQIESNSHRLHLKVATIREKLAMGTFQTSGGGKGPDYAPATLVSLRGHPECVSDGRKRSSSIGRAAGWFWRINARRYR